MLKLRYGVAVACSIPMDGFHYTRNILDTFSSPHEAHKRRGAPFTFDVVGLLQLLKDLKKPVTSSTVYAPSFDHAIKNPENLSLNHSSSLQDPRPGDIAILSSHRIIIIEGNYLCFYPPPSPGSDTNETYPSQLWLEVAKSFDENWVIETPLDVASSRLASRHLQAGIVATLEEGFARANGSDKENAENIIQQALYHRIVVAQTARLKMDPNIKHTTNLREIRSQLDQFRNDRTRYIKSSDIESLFRSLDVRPQDLQILGGDFVLPTHAERKSEAAVYSRHDLKTLEAKFDDINRILERGKEKYGAMWSDFFESQLDECRRALIPVVQSEMKELQERISEVENSRVNGKFLAPDGTVPEGQEVTTDLLEKCRFIADSIANRTLKVDPTFTKIYESLSAIKGKLEQLMLTQAWSMRETDLFEILEQLRQIDGGRVDGLFVGSDRTSPEDGQKVWISPEGQGAVNGLLEECYEICHQLRCQIEDS
ncbi:hypothetical protein Dda_6467 [Drechslerella dactyloides]|uniref:Uncharacterized protein n=1 Tax=Drechslerella dactyloides TaxID=74499 RepID=A0AAD6NHK4_DREDA|nr:hypothetical protein Dda_6467 [Drechslerella dactyloides]